MDPRFDNRPATDPAPSLVHSLARELNLPVDRVARVYRDEASKIESEARIMTFVPVIVASRVRAELRRQQSGR